jgi:ABC-2 type transport system permease protein
MSANVTTSAQASANTTGAAPLSKAVLAQTRAELTMTLRRGESVLVTLIIPLLLLIALRGFFKMPIDTLLPGVLAVAVMSSGMVSLGIATAYDRYYGVLKRLGSSPLPRWGLLMAKIVAVLGVEILQVISLVLVAAIFYGWRPAGAFWLIVPVLLLGTAAFAGLGMLMAGALRAEATLAGANGLFLFLLLFGGVFGSLGGVIGNISNALPSAALANSLAGALTKQGVSFSNILLLLIWAGIFIVAAALTFKWE